MRKSANQFDNASIAEKQIYEREKEMYLLYDLLSIYLLGGSLFIALCVFHLQINPINLRQTCTYIISVCQ